MVFLEISQNSQENTALFSCEFCETSKNTFFHRTPLWLVAASVNNVFFTDLTINAFLANVPIFLPLKTSENFWFSLVFAGARKWKPLTRMGQG